MTASPQRPNGRTGSLFTLAYPQSVAVFASHEEASKAVDFLAEKDFPVNNLAIVGTDLKTVERVLSKRTLGTVISRGASQGLGTAFIIFFLLWLFMPGVPLLSLLAAALAVSLGVSITFALIGYAATRGRRDYNSVQQTVATRYEILSEHKVAQQARDLVATMPGRRDDF